MGTKAIDILLADDSGEDVELITEILREENAEARLSNVEDGIELLAFLRREEGYAGAPRPDLILLDLNLPRKDGREALSEIKQSHDLRDIPIIILTTSDREQDILVCYHHHANCYVRKPADIDGLTEVMRSILYFWFSIAKLPSR